MEKWLEAFARTHFRRSADTAHDLKTPLNVAVLNLELLRMRIRKLAGGSDDPKVLAYTSAIEAELRRMAEIFDSFFLLSTPPKGEEPPALVDAAPIVTEEAARVGVPIGRIAAAPVLAHEARIREAFQLFFRAASRLLAPGTVRAAATRDRERLTVTVEGVPPAADFELTRLFKFYFTDPLGSPDLSMATARLVVETYGGELNATEESDKVVIRLSVPLGEE